MERISITVKPIYLIISAVVIAIAVVSTTALFIVTAQARPEYRTVDQQRINATFIYLEQLAKRKALLTPITCKQITSGYGWRKNPIRRFIGGMIVGYHEGIDIFATNATPVRASADGEVIGMGRSLIGGRYLVIDYGDDVTITYYHLSEYRVRGWDLVLRGDVIALSGNTGITTGAHLHVQTEYKGVSVNPNFFFQIAE